MNFKYSRNPAEILQHVLYSMSVINDVFFTQRNTDESLAGTLSTVSDVLQFRSHANKVSYLDLKFVSLQNYILKFVIN